jgi:glucose dehydrogenase
VLIGPEFKPFYPAEHGKDLGVSTWHPEGWKIGGGNPWGWISYDPELQTIYYGTGNPGPWNPEQRPGDNKWTAGLFARDIRTGQAKWFYHSSPHDLFDYDDITASILMDLPVGGTMRKSAGPPAARLPDGPWPRDGESCRRSVHATKLRRPQHRPHDRASVRSWRR